MLGSRSGPVNDVVGVRMGSAVHVEHSNGGNSGIDLRCTQSCVSQHRSNGLIRFLRQFLPLRLDD